MLSLNLHPHVQPSQKNHKELSIKREEIITEEISSLSMSISSPQGKWQCRLTLHIAFVFNLSTCTAERSLQFVAYALPIPPSIQHLRPKQHLLQAPPKTETLHDRDRNNKHAPRFYTVARTFFQFPTNEDFSSFPLNSTILYKCVFVLLCLVPFCLWPTKGNVRCRGVRVKYEFAVIWSDCLRSRCCRGPGRGSP